jgi:hypothetical protein
MSPTTHNILAQAAPLRLANTKRNMPLKRLPSHTRQWYVVLLQQMLGICLGFSIASSASAKTQLIGSLIDQQGKPTAALSELLALTDVPAVDNFNDLVKQTQAHWSQGGKERWEFDPRFEARRAQLMPVLRRLNVVDAIRAEDKHYRYGLVHGAIASAVARRLDFLVEEWQRGVRFDEIVFVTGQRRLDSALEKTFIDAGLKTEPEMMQYLWKSKALPAALKRLPLEIANALPVRSPDGQLKRPQTKDAIQAWLAFNPEPAKAVFISNQPHVGYQHAVAETTMPEQFDFETIGPTASDKTKISVCLDAIARWLYQESLKRQQ